MGDIFGPDDPAVKDGGFKVWEDDSGNCPRCASPAPHLHPAIQHEGEVQPCPHSFHETVTPENTPEKIASVRAVLSGPNSK